MKRFLIYGANGYTGELITRFAAEQGLSPILAGRNPVQIGELAQKFGFESRVFSLEDREKLDAALSDVDFVIHCAGPFSLTSDAMVEACLRTKTHYLDITGEIAVFEAMAARDSVAAAAEIMIMPGVGFDVVPSDCLAVHLKKRLPSATELTLAFFGLGGISHGTRATMTMNIGNGGAVRRDGKIVGVPPGFKTLDVDFGPFRRTAVTIPWGDVATAFHSTGIPNIEVYTVIPESQIPMLRLSRYVNWLLGSSPVQSVLHRMIPAGGPSDEARAKGTTYLWGRASDLDGNSVVSRQFGPEGYTLTALSSLAIARKILDGDFKIGFQTPGGCYGPDLILEIEGTSREDVE